MTKIQKRLALLLCAAILFGFVPFVPVAHAATDGVVQASGEGVLNANRVNVRPAPSTKNTPLGKANKGDVFRVTGFTIPKGFSQGFFQVEGSTFAGSAFIAANYLNVSFDAPLFGEVTKKGYLYTGKSTSRRNRAQSIALGDTLPLLAREGKWWRTEVNGQTLWVQVANVQTVESSAEPSTPASGLVLTPATTANTYGSVRVTVSGAEGASFVGWRRHTTGATYTNQAGFTGITNSKAFTANRNGWYAVGVVDASGQFHYELIHITNILEYTGDSGSATIPKTNITFTAMQTGGTSRVAYSTGIELTFSQAVSGLTAGNIAITDGTTGAAVKGATLSGSGTTWTIALDDVTTEGDVNVSIADFGTFHVTNNPQSVDVYRGPTRYTLNVNIVTVCGSGSGSVNIQNQQADYRPGASVTVNATPSAPYEFLKWVDGDSLSANQVSTNASHTFNLTSDTTLYAVFSMPSSAFQTASGIIITNGVVTDGSGATSAVVIPGVVDGAAVTSINQTAFRSNTNVTSVTLPAGLQSIEHYAFQYCNNLTSVTLPNGLQSIGNSTFEGCGLTGALEIPASVTIIDLYAFLDNTSLTSVTFLGNRPTIGATAFSGCTSLADIYYTAANQTGWPGADINVGSVVTPNNITPAMQ